MLWALPFMTINRVIIMKFNKLNFAELLCEQLDNVRELSWREISALARDKGGFKEGGNYLEVRSALQMAIDAGYVVRIKDVHTERYKSNG